MFNLRDKLKKTRESFSNPLKKLFQRGAALDPDDEDAVEELLLGSDIGVDACEHFMDMLRENAGGDDPREFLRREFLELLGSETPAAGHARPRAIMVIGVNGVGKTTSIAKLTRLLQGQGETVLLAACDTFRAAAVDQLGIWAERLGVEMIRHQDGSDPAAVAFDACNAAKSRNVDTVIIDTAGRLHTRVNLMEELAKIKRTCTKALGEDSVETLLALDATLGQNSLVQAQEFTKRQSADGIILTKLDSTAKGGIVVAIRRTLGIPVRYIGVGEQLDDFGEFSSEDFVEALLG